MFAKLIAFVLIILAAFQQHPCSSQPAYAGRGFGATHGMKNAPHTGHNHHRLHQPGEAVNFKPVKITKDKDLIRDKEHIREELGEFMKDKDVANMKPEELEFHYFRLHDTDNNNKLDGLELLAALMHVHDDDEEGDHEEIDEDALQAELKLQPGDSPEVKAEKQRKSGDYYRKKAEERRKKIETFKFFTQLIDEALSEDDHNNDGYLNYMEFVAARRREDSDDDTFSWF